MPDHFYIYPAYLTKGTRSLGRRVPLPASVPEASVEAIVAAAKSLGYSAEAEPTKSYPRQFQTYAGRVKVHKKEGMSKGQSLREIVHALHRLPAPGAPK